MHAEKASSQTRSTRPAWLLVAALIALLPGAVSAADLIQVPIRWCWMEGSGTFKKWVEGQDPQSILHRRTQRANDIWRAQADIEFFPVSIFWGGFEGMPIQDPQPEGPGNLGDVQLLGSALSASEEVLEAVHVCERQWEIIETSFRLNFSGITAINIGWTVLSGAVVGLTVLKDRCGTGAWPDVCEDPTRLTDNSGVAIIAIDEECYTGSRYCSPDFTVKQNETEVVLPHELGHALWLGHGNGVDDDGDGLVDGCCDGEENPLSTDNLMTGGTQAGTLLTPEQVARARAIARATPGARVLTPTGFVNGDVIADSALDSLGDAQDGAVDMVALDMSINSATQTLSVSHRLRRTIPDSGSYRFVAFLDLDDDASTGGEPASLGFDTEFRGVEWITQVEIVEVGPSDQDIVVTAWQYAAGGFEQRTPDPGIRSFIDRHGELETDAAVFDRVGIEMSLQEVGALGERVVLQAQAQVEGSEVRDLLPNGGGAAGDLVRLSAPRVVDCAATPSPVRPGAELTVAASGLALNAEATVRFEGEVVASMTSNDQGEARVSFFVPFDQAESVAEIDVRNPAGGDMATGTRCTVGVKGPALVTVDIKPGTSVNPINLRSQGVVSVAILGSNLLNVADIDVTTLAFGPSGATPAPKNRVQLEDVNDDGLADLITHYRTQDLGITPRQGEACVRGMTFGGIPFAGCDAILTIASSGLGFELVLLLLPLMWLCARRRWAH